MFSIVGYSETNTPDGTLQKIDAVPDQHIRVETTKIYVPDMNNLIGEIACMGALALEARLISPSLRRTNPFYITPIESAIVPSDEPKGFLHPDCPIPLDKNESLEVEGSGTAGAARVVVFGVMLSDGAIAPVTGQIFTVNAEVTLTMVAGVWVFANISFPDSLPVADYDVVGARVIAAGGVLFRFVPVGAAHRPGAIVSQDTGDKVLWEQRAGRLGVWFTFNTVQPPGIEILASSAPGAGTFQLYIDMIKH